MAKKEEIKLDIPLEGVKAKLQTARVMLQETNLKKTGVNKYAGFEFFQLDDFLPSINKIFAKLGLYSEFTIAPQTIDYEEKVIFNEEYNELTKTPITKTPIIRELATLVIYDITKPEDTVMYEMEVAPVMIGNNTKQNIYQAAGGRNTYYKRYLYMNALEIVEKDESDTVLGQEGVNYQQPQMTPYDFMPQQSVPQNAPFVPQPQTVVPQNTQTVPQPVNEQVASNVENAIKQEITGTEPLSTESKMEIMQITNSKNLNGAEIIGRFCKENNLGNTNELLECHKQALIDMINSYGE